MPPPKSCSWDLESGRVYLPPFSKKLFSNPTLEVPSLPVPLLLGVLLDTSRSYRERARAQHLSALPWAFCKLFASVGLFFCEQRWLNQAASETLRSPPWGPRSWLGHMQDKQKCAEDSSCSWSPVLSWSPLGDSYFPEQRA